MLLDDLKKLLTSPTLLRLDTMLSPRLISLFYGVGLAAIGLWAIGHFVATFSSNFGNGLWGLLEILVYGLGALVLLRIVCEGMVLYFREHDTEDNDEAPRRVPSTLLEDVREAIHDLAEDDDDGIVPATDPAPFIHDPDLEPPVKAIKRTARRAPPKL